MASTDARPVPQKNVAYRVTFPILDADGDLVTGATGLDSEVSKDGGAFADCTNEATEIATSSGMYYLDLTATEMNADTVAVIVKSSGKTTPIVMYPEEAGDIRVNVTQVAGTTQTAGDIIADTNDIQARLPAALVSGRIDASVGAMAAGVVTAAAIATDAIDADAIADNAINAGAIAADAITAAKIADGAIDANTFAAGAINAAAIAADAITDAKVASDVTIASVTGAVGSVTGNVGGNVVGSIGSVATGGITAGSIAADAIGASELAADAVTEIQSGLATAAALTTVDTVVDAIQAKTDNLPSDPADASVVAGLISGLDAKLDTIDNFIDTEITSLITMLTGIVPVSGTIGATGNDTTHLHLSGLAYADDGINSMLLTIKDVSTGLFYSRWIEDFANTGDLATVATLPFTPEASVDLYWITPVRSDVTTAVDPASVRAAVGLASANLDTQLDALPTNAELATALGTADDAVLARLGTPAGASIAADIIDIEGKVDDLETRLGTPSNLGSGATVAANLADIEAQTDDIGAAGAGLTAVPWNAAWDTEVQSECADALATYDPPTHAELVSEINAVQSDIAALNNPSAATIADAVWDEDATGHQTQGTFGQAIGDPGADTDTIWALANTNLNATVGSRSSQTSVDDLPTNAELTTALGTADDAVLAQVALVKAKTDNLPSDPADQSAVEAAITAATSPLATAVNLATVAGYLDTEVAAILADTNELQTDWANGGRLDLILDARASQSSVDDLPTNAELATALAGADDPTLAAIAALNNLSQVQAQTAAAAALTAYDPPTRAEATADKDEVIVQVNANETKIDTVDTVVDAIKLKTDSLTFTSAGKVDANIKAVNSVAVDGTGVSGDEWGPV